MRETLSAPERCVIFVKHQVNCFGGDMVTNVLGAMSALEMVESPSP